MSSLHFVWMVPTYVLHLNDYKVVNPPSVCDCDYTCPAFPNVYYCNMLLHHFFVLCKTLKIISWDHPISYVVYKFNPIFEFTTYNKYGNWHHFKFIKLFQLSKSQWAVISLHWKIIFPIGRFPISKGYKARLPYMDRRSPKAKSSTEMGETKRDQKYIFHLYWNGWSMGGSFRDLVSCLLMPFTQSILSSRPALSLLSNALRPHLTY